MATPKAPKDSTPAKSVDPLDPKERFRLALEAKKSKGGHNGSNREESGSGTKGESHRAGGKREHRRKSG